MNGADQSRRDVPSVTQLARQFTKWEKTKDLVDQLIDITLNYRQSDHPGGSRSKVQILLALRLD